MATTASEWLDNLVLIASDGIYFDGVKMPGLIAEGGITIEPQGQDVNRMTVEFLVGRVFVQDPTTKD